MIDAFNENITNVVAGNFNYLMPGSLIYNNMS